MIICGDFHDPRCLFRYVNKQTKICQIFEGPKPSQEKKFKTSFWWKMLWTSSLKSRDQFIPKKRVNFIVYFCFEKMLKFAKNLETRKAWSAIFLASFITMESSKISSSTADLYSGRSLSIFLGCIITGVPWWLGG